MKIIILKKDIKHLYLKINRSTAEVVISAPNKMSDSRIQSFIDHKKLWIENKLKNLKNPESDQVYEQGEIFLFQGREYSLNIIPIYSGKDKMVLTKSLDVHLKNFLDKKKIESLVNQFYKDQLFKEINLLAPQWQKTIGVEANEFTVRKMKTKWGRCNTRTKSICLNLELIKKPRRLLEYVLVHELVHLIEASHNAYFKELMTKFLVNWKILKKELNYS